MKLRHHQFTSRHIMTEYQFTDMPSNPGLLIWEAHCHSSFTLRRVKSHNPQRVPKDLTLAREYTPWMNDLSQVGALNLLGFRSFLFWIRVFNEAWLYWDIYSYLQTMCWWYLVNRFLIRVYHFMIYCHTERITWLHFIITYII